MSLNVTIQYNSTSRTHVSRHGGTYRDMGGTYQHINISLVINTPYHILMLRTQSPRVKQEQTRTRTHRNRRREEAAGRDLGGEETKDAVALARVRGAHLSATR